MLCADRGVCALLGFPVDATTVGQALLAGALLPQGPPGWPAGSGWCRYKVARAPRGSAQSEQEAGGAVSARAEGGALGELSAV